MSNEKPERQKCECCGGELSFTWCDTHGVGACMTCGLPYTIYHYEKNAAGDEVRVKKPPSVAINPEGVMLAKRYWDGKKRRVFPACYDFMPGNGSRSYSGATTEDVELFDEWYGAQPETIAAKAAKVDRP